jgi:hypothetical protein
MEDKIVQIGKIYTCDLFFFEALTDSIEISCELFDSKFILLRAFGVDPLPCQIRTFVHNNLAEATKILP